MQTVVKEIRKTKAGSELIFMRDEDTKEISVQINLPKEKGKDQEVIVLSHDSVMELAYLLEYWAPTH